MEGYSGSYLNPFRYSGEYFDEETGFYYLRARYYDPSIGRFLTEDPAEDGTNWYAYIMDGLKKVFRDYPRRRKHADKLGG